MGYGMQEASAKRTGIAQNGRRIPDWLRPYKDQWLSSGKIKQIIAADGRYFAPWFDEIRPRLRSVTAPATNGTVATKYLVRHVWAASLAHNVRLTPTEASNPREVLVQEIEDLRRDLAVAQAETRVEYVEVDRTADSIETIRLLLTATEPQPRPGVYFLLDAGGSVLYVGQSRNVLSRMVGHGAKEYSTVRMLQVADEKQRLEIEARLIQWLQPPLNLIGFGSNKPFRISGLRK